MKGAGFQIASSSLRSGARVVSIESALDPLEKASWARPNIGNKMLISEMDIKGLNASQREGIHALDLQLSNAQNSEYFDGYDGNDAA